MAKGKRRKVVEKIRTVAVIDIGTSSIRMSIAEIGSSSEVKTLENLTQAVALGKETFSRGEIGRRTIEECISILKSYKRKLDEYGISRPEDIRLVATSSVREAANQLTFVDRVFVATGLSVEVLDAAEIHRITYRGVQPLLEAQPHLYRSQAFVCEVGGGNTEVLVLEQGNVAWSRAYRLGSLRLQIALQASRVPRVRSRQIIESEVHSQLEAVPEYMNPDLPISLVTMGSDVRFACHEILKKQVTEDSLIELPVAKLARFVDRLFAKSEDALTREYHLAPGDAEQIGPALAANLKIAETLGVDHILVTAANLRDGLIRDLSEGGGWSEDFRQQIIRAAWKLARKYDVDEDHARSVANLSQQLFVHLQREHTLDARYETLLYAAAVLHEIGAYVSSSSVHKHSMYLLMNSQLFGLTADDLQLVALVTRYHRRALPKPTHTAYNLLDRQRRVTVAKLASILRIAIALDASRTQRVQSINCNRVRDRIIITVPGVDDLSIEQLALRNGRQFFQSIFGKDVLLRTEIKQLRTETSSQL